MDIGKIDRRRRDDSMRKTLNLFGSRSRSDELLGIGEELGRSVEGSVNRVEHLRERVRRGQKKTRRRRRDEKDERTLKNLGQSS